MNTVKKKNVVGVVHRPLQTLRYVHQENSTKSLWMTSTGWWWTGSLTWITVTLHPLRLSEWDWSQMNQLFQMILWLIIFIRKVAYSSRDPEILHIDIISVSPSVWEWCLTAPLQGGRHTAAALDPYWVLTELLLVCVQLKSCSCV